MNIELLRHFFLWCTVIDLATLLLWAVLTMAAAGWMQRLCSRLFSLSAEQFYAINFTAMLLYKAGIILFNLVPLIGLYLIG